MHGYSSLNNTLAAVNTGTVTGDKLANPLDRTRDNILNVLTLGIYGAIARNSAEQKKTTCWI